MTRPRLVGLSANVQRPSKTRTLVDTIVREAAAHGPVEARVFDFVDAGSGLGAAWTREPALPPRPPDRGGHRGADGLVVASPVYKGSFTGLFKHLFDLIDPPHWRASPSPSPRPAAALAMPWWWSIPFGRSSDSSARCRCQSPSTPRMRISLMVC